MAENKKDFLFKKISQTEYRGSKYYSFFSKSTQFLATEFPDDLSVPEAGKAKLKAKILKSIKHFLSKTVGDEVADNILKSSVVKDLLRNSKVL